MKTAVFADSNRLYATISYYCKVSISIKKYCQCVKKWLEAVLGSDVIKSEVMCKTKVEKVINHEGHEENEG